MSSILYSLYTIHSSEQPLVDNVNCHIIEEEEALLHGKRGIILQHLVRRILGDINIIPLQWYLYDLKFKYDTARFNYLNLAFPQISIINNQLQMVWQDKYIVYNSILSSFLGRQVSDEEMNEIVTHLHLHMNLTYLHFINHINHLTLLMNQKLLTVKLSLFDIPPRSTSLNTFTLDPNAYNYPSIADIL